MSNIDEDFFNALVLLHSTEEDSAEKLGQMLDACIEKKYGSGKTLAARMPTRFLQNDDMASSMRLSKKCDCTEGSGAVRNKCGFETISLLETDVAENIVNYKTTDVKMFKINYEDCCDDEDVPRISIPDEGSIDGTVCKICNGAKLGPLILLECQECQETYHPLCHQPPVIDIDIYDPRFVWRCRRCVETTSVISSRVETVEKVTVEKVGRNNDTVKEDINISGLKMSGKRDDNPFGKNDSQIENKSEESQLCDSSFFVKDLANLSQRNGSLSSFMQSRKRIGSKSQSPASRLNKKVTQVP